MDAHLEKVLPRSVLWDKRGEKIMGASLGGMKTAGLFDRQGRCPTSLMWLILDEPNRWGGGGTAPGYVGHGTASAARGGVTIILTDTLHRKKRRKWPIGIGIIPQGGDHSYDERPR